MPSATIELICFPGAPNLPIFVGTDKGYFAEAGVAVELTTTPSSAYQAEHLVAGDFRIAGTAFDNVVAYCEDAGVVTFDTTPDLFAFMGATQVELALLAAPEVKTIADLKGRSLALDAVATGFAFVVYEMLTRAGLDLEDCEMVPVGATPARFEAVRNGTHAAGLALEPFTSMGRAQGLNVLATSTELFDCYQGGTFAASRAWAAANGDTVKGFIRGYLRALDWVLAPQNRAEGAEILMRNMEAIKPPVVDRVMGNLLNPRVGLTPRAEILDDGVKTVLELRSRYGGGKALTDPARYIDLSYYNAVIAEGA